MADPTDEQQPQTPAPDSFSGGWRPNAGADETINVAYDIGGTRLA